ncbi:putative polyprotein [Phytophthora infestans]|uniref:Putative polyprotein n=1 Tax=Phytophthora infestans TaxID=4787 RepID=A0A8S9U5V5_PHYIN|nr:putative polyprotein [Phytophthora infestans]
MLWARQLITEMTMEIKGPTKVLLDNKAAISMVTNNGYTSRAKHIELRVHFIKDHVQKHTIEIEHVISKLQLADYLTKPLPTPQFATLVNKSGVVNFKVQEQQVEGVEGNSYTVTYCVGQLA